jgi:pimeloyl-ACP methyl ester carboxylesterase
MLDPFRSPGRVERLADRTSAEIATLAEAGHFWMLDEPEEAAQLITDFWEALP